VPKDETLKFVAFAKVLWFDDGNYLYAGASISFCLTANGQCDYRSWLPRLITPVEMKRFAFLQAHVLED
jgi:hypothetical protein